ncbi:hypothetical protein [endosymbiont 'TC1' of Trimyema compressum]|uniref:hypothetical protein n=1 Tax=endosymbiont 'TC1' of Trimyema compressum TaxID=243899 RepID=UPI0013922549|nr:hypothetical protein [endosymbiont 'TC1' of Trimyema compressum]
MYFFFSQFNSVDSSSFTLRETSHRWYEEKTLYEDLFSDFDFMDVTKGEKVKAEEYFKNRSAPTLDSIRQCFKA